MDSSDHTSASISTRKKELRTSMHAKRNGIEINVKKNIDAKICERIESKIIELNAKTVHLYLPIQSEINLYPLIDKLLTSDIILICPKTLPNRKLENRILHSIFELESGPMGTKHPLQPDVFDGDIDLIIVPGLAYDKNNYRLGYGGGYYDNFLVNQPNAFKLGIFYSIQEVVNVPREPHDIQLDEIFVGK